jgi:hypothetical protein
VRAWTQVAPRRSGDPVEQLTGDDDSPAAVNDTTWSSTAAGLRRVRYATAVGTPGVGSVRLRYRTAAPDVNGAVNSTVVA